MKSNKFVLVPAMLLMFTVSSTYAGVLCDWFGIMCSDESKAAEVQDTPMPEAAPEPVSAPEPAPAPEPPAPAPAPEMKSDDITAPEPPNSDAASDASVGDKIDSAVESIQQGVDSAVESVQEGMDAVGDKVDETMSADAPAEAE